MKNLIRTYVDPILEDRLKLLAESSGSSLSSLTCELIQKGLDSDFTAPSNHESPVCLEELLYLQYLTLQVVLNTTSIEPELFLTLKQQSRQWAQQKSGYSNNNELKED